MARARCPRSSVKAGQKCVKIKGTRKSNILLTSEFVVDSGASMHMISKKDLSDAEMDTVTKSCSPTIVITANGNGVCQRIGYILDCESPRKHASSVVARKALRMKNGYSYEWINGQKPYLI